MSSTSLGRPKARRALRDRRRAEVLDESAFSDDSGIKSIITHGLAALAISALGLGVAASVGLTSTAQAENASTNAALSADIPDVTRAVPAVQSKELSRENQAAVQESQQNKTDTSTGDLAAFSNRTDSTSRNAVRSSLDKALAVEQANQRASTLTQNSDRVAQTSRNAVQGARASGLKASQNAIQAEAARLKAEQEKAKNDKKKKSKDERAGGSLTAAAAASAVDVTQISGSGGAAPIAKGRYSIAARWGAVGAWARYHTGIDLSAPVGTPIHAAADGVVQGPAAGAGWAGIHVVIKHADGGQTLYAHMANTTVRAGQVVKAGDVIGHVGMTGRTFGPHCHFEYYPAGARPGDVYSSKDPYVWMLSKGVKL